MDDDMTPTDLELTDAVDRIMAGAAPVSSLLRQMKSKMERVDREFHQDATTHRMADIHLMRLCQILAKGHPEEDAAEEIIQLWRTVARQGFDGNERRA
jgi:hypothetical protein